MKINEILNVLVLLGYLWRLDFISKLIFFINSNDFNIDELIITENIHSGIIDYFHTNGAYGIGLKFSLWISENILWGGPSAWRVHSVIGLLGIAVICYRILKSIHAQVVWLPFVAYLCIASAAQFYGRWGMTGYMLSSAVLCWAFSRVWYWQSNSFPQLLIFGLWSFLVALVISFFYLGEGVAFMGLIFSACVWNLYQGWDKAWRYWLKALPLVLASIMLATGLMVWANGGLSAPRTSVQPLYFPTSGVSLWHFSTNGLFSIVTQTSAVASYVSNRSLYGLAALTVWSCYVVPPSAKAGLTKMVAILTLWIGAMLAGIWILSLLGYAPFGDLRYIKALIWAGPLWIICLNALFALVVKEWLIGSYSGTSGSHLISLGICGSILVFFGFFTLKSTWEYRSSQAENFEKTQVAYHWKTDLVLADELHKFGFEYLTHKTDYLVMSRSYTCQNGQFWNAYGWNSCDLMKIRPLASYNDQLKSAESLLVISRGPFDQKNYQLWFELVSSSGFKLVRLQNFGGPYVSLWQKPKLDPKVKL